MNYKICTEKVYKRIKEEGPFYVTSV